MSDVPLGTQVATSFPIEIGNTVVNLIDTPGFDDTNRYDTEVLEEISTFLATHYKLGGRLCGLIYLHPISDNRMRGTARLNLEMFQELCGIDSLRNVVLASTMWDLVPQQVGEEREAELASKPEFWGICWRMAPGSNDITEVESLRWQSFAVSSTISLSSLRSRTNWSTRA